MRHFTEHNKRNQSPELKMEEKLLIFIVLFQHSVTTGISDDRISIFAHEMDDVILPLAQHLLHQIDLVIWNKGEERVATHYRSGSVHFEDPGYGAILNISNDGSLILKARSWKDGEEYSANITLNDNSQSSINYCVKAHHIKFTPHDMGPQIVYAKLGEEMVLPLELEADIDKSEIEEIDWLTDGWNYFAVTKVEGDIRILENDYAGCLANSPDGSLIFKRVTKRHEGNYRACIFSNNGIIVERNYQVHISDCEQNRRSADRPSENIFSLHGSLQDPLILLSLIIITIVCFFISFFIFLRNRGKKDKPSPSPEQVKIDLSEEKHKNPEEP